MAKSIKTKLIVRIVVSFILLSITFQTITFYSFRNLTIIASKEKALTIAGLVRDAITSLMVLGVVEGQDVYIDRIKNTYGLKSINIVRAKSVIKQFGTSNTSNLYNPLANEVLSSGMMRGILREDFSSVEYELVIPYKAASGGKVKCTLCHNAKDGEVLGVISVVMDLSKERKQGVSSVSTMVIVSLLFSIVTLYIIYVFFKPYTELFKKLKNGFSKVSDGVFSDQIEVALKDEAGDVANSYNNMLENLSKTLENISDKVSLLIGHEMSKTGNAMRDTMDNVDMLVKIYKFKRTIEKDTKKIDIYMRFDQIFEELKIANYSVYEIKQNNNTIVKISHSIAKNLEGKLAKEEIDMWCQEIITTNANECRAKRTGVIVNCFDFPNICPNFAYQQNYSSIKLYHYCIPVYIGEYVGIVVQLIFDKENMEDIMSKIPYIQSYMQEGEPVLEAKTFMELLREQSLVDQLTGLYNRRYLEEIHANVCAQVIRRKTNLGILMIDIDFFKQVNDTYGHDTGDAVLSKVAGIIKQTVRDADIVIRYGGEEILVLLIDTVPEKSKEVAEKVRQNIEEESIAIPGGELKKTVSIGVSNFPTHADKFWQCIKFADTVLYKAKKDGRNKVCMFNKEMWQSEEY